LLRLRDLQRLGKQMWLAPGTVASLRTAAGAAAGQLEFLALLLLLLLLLLLQQQQHQL
jgi:hypothetical protein